MTILVCPACGHDAPAGDVFCSYCGARLAAGSSRRGAPPRSAPQSRSKNWFDRAAAAIEGFWQRVTEGIEIQELWTRFRVEARSSYALFSRDVVWERGRDESRWKRDVRIARTFFWAVVMKLSPSRRILLLIALALFVLALADEQPFEWLLTVLAVALLLTLELADRVVMKRDLEIAREIQNWLVPKAPPEVAGVDIAFATRPANTVAGDYYDAFLRPVMDGAAPPAAAGHSPDRLALVVADVAGKSVPAALLMATFQASLRTLAAAPVPLLDLVARLNQYACAHSLGGLRYTTAFFAEFDTASRTLAYVNAGHNYPMLFRAAGGFDRLETGGLPLGIRQDASYQSATLVLDPGDELVVFTDGLVEAVNEREEEFGEMRLLELLNTVRDGSSAEQLSRIMAGVEAFVGAARQHDDITCLLLRAR
ncbi:MAG: SpoIIE family protein phosphatase [Terriglobia bacterium]